VPRFPSEILQEWSDVACVLRLAQTRQGGDPHSRRVRASVRISKQRENRFEGNASRQTFVVAEGTDGAQAAMVGSSVSWLMKTNAFICVRLPEGKQGG